MTVEQQKFYILVPVESMDEWKRLFVERDRLFKVYNEVMGKIFAIEPNKNNFEECEKNLLGIRPEADEYGRGCMKWLNDMSKFETQLTYQFDGTAKENFAHINLKLTIASFVTEMDRAKLIMLRAFNDLAG